MILYQKTLGCGCKLQDYGKGSLRIKYCPKHDAADDMLEALVLAMDLRYELRLVIPKLEAAISRATAQD